MPDNTPIDANSILAALEAAASGPESVSTDAGSVKQYSLMDLLAAHKYLAAIQSAQQQPRSSGLRFAQLLPPGTVQRNYYPTGFGSDWPQWRRS